MDHYTIVILRLSLPLYEIYVAKKFQKSEKVNLRGRKIASRTNLIKLVAYLARFN